MTNLCKNGLPDGDIFEYAAFLFQNFENKWKELKSKEIKEKIMRYKEEKQKSVRLSKFYLYFLLNLIINFNKSFYNKFSN